jgi:peptidoglycan-associated lipoprotein
VVPPVAPETAADPFSNNLDLSIEAGQTDASNESLPLTTSEPAELTSEPTDGN